MKYTRLLSTILFLLVSLSPYIYPEPEQEEWITIFIHGTIGLRPQMAFRTLIKIWRDKITNSSYEQAVERIRNDPFFYKNQAMQKIGLHPIDLSNHEPGAAASLFAQVFDSFVHSANQYEHNHYYTFGWSGLVSSKMRYVESKILYRELSDELKKYAARGIYPKIRIVGFSHGGNLALNLASIHDKDHPNDTFIIEELLFVGMPVQKETDYLMCNSFFNRVYNIYSRGDHIQRLDCFSLRRFFSNRRFCNNSRYRLPEKLVQIELKISAPGKRCCLRKRSANNPGSRYGCDRSPGHMELWFFGWPTTSSSSYREHFPLYPLPATVLTPQIIEIVRRYAPHKKHIVLELRPDEEQAIIRSRHRNNKKIVPFTLREKLKNLQAMALTYKPENYTRYDYQAHINNAINTTKNKKNVRNHRNKNCLCDA